MKKTALWPVLCLALALGLASCTRTQQEPPVPAVNVILTGLDGQEYAFDGLQGKGPLMFLFWTTWCPYCREELQELSRRRQDLSSRGWQVYAIDVGESRQKVLTFLQTQELGLDVLLDADTQAARFFRVVGVPTLLLIDKNGRVVHRGHRMPADPDRYLSKEQ